MVASRYATLAVVASVVVLVGIRLVDPIATGVADVAGLAILGSTGGGAALLTVIPLVVIGGIVLSAVALFFRRGSGE